MERNVLRSICDALKIEVQERISEQWVIETFLPLLLFLFLSGYFLVFKEGEREKKGDGQ